ncbi:MAG: phospholipase D-like domain-containing protein [Betaproteobacteria bacterium]
MAKIKRAFAFANNEVAFLAWELDTNPLPGCLGFHIVREYLDAQDNVVEERPLASYVAFRGQQNKEWQAQNTTVWPVQKFSWRDLTLRKRRNGESRRPENDRVRYRIRAVGKWRAGLDEVEVIAEQHTDKASGEVVVHAYEGKPVRLGYLTNAMRTNIIDVTRSRPPFSTTFTNGILSTQFLRTVLAKDGKVQPGALEAHLRKPDDWLRNFLAGDVIPTIREFFDQPKGRFHAALYELEDGELVQLLADNAERIDLVLSDAGSGTDEDGEENENGNKPSSYDTRNAPARKLLRKLARKPGTKFTMQDRLFNGSNHIGHNKFVVYVDKTGKAQSVLTGSTNWTWSGLSGQSNNCIRIDDSDIAGAYLDYWQRLFDDKQPTPKPKLSSKATGAGQSDALKEANGAPVVVKGAGYTMEAWYSPNVPGKKVPPPAKTSTAPPPADMARLFSLMRKAKRAIFFLVFMPSRGGVNSIVSEAVALGQKDPSLAVLGAISDTQAMWGYKPGSKDDETGKKTPADSPHVFTQGGVSVVRATALTDKEIGRELGNFQLDEKLTVGRAIIHDKILVLDPMDPVNCTVAFGSHNFGYKASYANDENMVIVRGHQALALAYAAHVLDVYDHYRFRAAEAEQRAKAKSGAAKKAAQWDGFLATNDDWQKHSSHRISDYFLK